MSKGLEKVRVRKKPSAIIMNVLAVIAVGVLVYIALNTDFRLIWSYVQTIPLALFIFLLCLQLFTQFSLNYQWFRLCKVLGLEASFGRLLVVNAYGTVVDAANPGEKVGGEVARILQLNNMLGFSTNQSTSLVTIQKFLSLASLIILNAFAVVTLSDNISFLSRLPIRIVFLIILLVFAALIIYSLFFTEKLNVRIQRIKSQGKVANWIKVWMVNFTRDTQVISEQPREWLFQFILSLLIWSLFPIKLFIIVSRYTQVNLLVMFAITFVSYFAAMIPLLPGGLGTFEATMSGMLIAYGLGVEQAMALSLIFRFITFWFVVLFSILIILPWKISNSMRRAIDDA